MLWATPQAGPNPILGLNLTDVHPGDNYTLLDGTETIATGSKSVAFARGSGPVLTDAGTTFYVSGCSNNSIWEVQGSNGVPSTQAWNLDNFDASFQAILGSQTTGNGAYTDVGRAAYYRIAITTFEASDAPVAIAKR